MNTVSSTQTRMWIHTHNSQSRRDSTRPNSYTCPDSNWGQRRETTGWFLSCARGKRSFPPSSLAFPNSWANFSIVNWDKLQCYLANLNLSGNGGCSDKKNREVQGTRKSIRKKKHAYFLQHPEGAILVIVNWCYLCWCEIHVGCEYIFCRRTILKHTLFHRGTLCRNTFYWYIAVIRNILQQY